MRRSQWTRHPSAPPRARSRRWRRCADLSMQTEARPAQTAQTVEMTYREAVAAALMDEMAADPTVILMGEDVGASGGVFKTNEGVLERFGESRVLNTPICENGFLGVALGMAVTGLRPVVEIMFSDFLPTAGDAIVNELPKFRFMSGGQCRVPLTVRAIGGGAGRLGTQHSATGEWWYLQLPGLKVAAAASPSAAYGLLRAAIREDDPVLVFEHKGLLLRKGTVVRDASSVREGRHSGGHPSHGRPRADSGRAAQPGWDRRRGDRSAMAAPTRRGRRGE